MTPEEPALRALYVTYDEAAAAGRADAWEQTSEDALVIRGRDLEARVAILVEHLRAERRRSFTDASLCVLGGGVIVALVVTALRFGLAWLS